MPARLGWPGIRLLMFFLIAGRMVFPAFQSAEPRNHANNISVKANAIDALWRDPGDIPSLDLAYGAGGLGHAPKPNGTYQFVKEDLAGSSPKFYVQDQDGVQWLVKLGEEARAETAATRLVWAMGYFVDEDYFVPDLRVLGMPKLHRKSKSVDRDGTISNARLKRRTSGEKKIGNWAWSDNPFNGTRELNGLRVLMALMNNWDLKTENNKIYGEKQKEQPHDNSENPQDRRAADLESRHARYVVSDLGASFGRTGGFSSRSKGKVNDFEKDNFIEAANAEHVDFVMRTTPASLLRHLKPRYYRQRVAMAQTVKNVPRADAKWMGTQLAKLSPDQIRTALLAGGFSTAETEEYLKVLRERISELNAL